MSPNYRLASAFLTSTNVNTSSPLMSMKPLKNKILIQHSWGCSLFNGWHFQKYKPNWNSGLGGDWEFCMKNEKNISNVCRLYFDNLKFNLLPNVLHNLNMMEIKTVNTNCFKRKRSDLSQQDTYPKLHQKRDPHQETE